jgi:cell division protein ZapA
MADSRVENKVIVNIFGEEYPITAKTDSASISRIADYVDSRMRELAKISRSQARDKLVILAAMSIASELFENRDSLSTVNQDFTDRLSHLIARLDQAIAGAAASAG